MQANRATGGSFQGHQFDVCTGLLYFLEVFLAGDFFAAVFLGAAFFAGDFLTAAVFLGAVFLGEAFLGAAFLGEAFLGAAFFGDATYTDKMLSERISMVHQVSTRGSTFFAAVFLAGTALAAFLAGDFCSTDYDMQKDERERTREYVRSAGSRRRTRSEAYLSGGGFLWWHFRDL